MASWPQIGLSWKVRGFCRADLVANYVEFLITPDQMLCLFQTRNTKRRYLAVPPQRQLSQRIKSGWYVFRNIELKSERSRDS